MRRRGRTSVERHGPFAVAVLNAGVSTGLVVPEGEVPVVQLGDDTYRRIMSINVDGVVFGTRAVLPAMLEEAPGTSSSTASLAGLVPIGGDPVYGLTKHAVVGFVRSMAAALEGRGVAISAICPGFVDTNILSPAARQRIASSASACSIRPRSPTWSDERSTRASAARSG